MKIKVSKNKLTSTIEILREEVELSNTRTASVLYIPNTLSLTSARKRPQAKIPVAFLFSKLHCNNVTEMLFFTAAILLCAVQNQRITLMLNKLLASFYC